MSGALVVWAIMVGLPLLAVWAAVWAIVRINMGEKYED